MWGWKYENKCLKKTNNFRWNQKEYWTEKFDKKIWKCWISKIVILYSFYTNTHFFSTAICEKSYEKNKVNA